MRLIQLAALCALAFVHAGCVYSVHPILHESDLKNELDLSGEWELQVKDPKQKGNKLTVEGFSKGVASQYDISWSDKDFVAQIGKIGDDYYVQVQKLELTPEAPPLLTALPVYAIAKIKFTDDKLEVFKIDETLAVPFMKKSKVAFIRYKPGPEFFVLTGATESLQDLIRQSGGELFSKIPMTFIRTRKPDEQAHTPEHAIQPNLKSTSPPRAR